MDESVSAASPTLVRLCADSLHAVCTMGRHQYQGSESTVLAEVDAGGHRYACAHACA